MVHLRTLACLLFAVSCLIPAARAADDFDELLKPLFKANCTRCHGGKKPKGKVDLEKLEKAQHLLARPELIEELIDVLDASAMPPEDEPQLSPEDREQLLAGLKRMLRTATAGNARAESPIRRLNRFQYNNCVKDLFQLKSDLFALPEKLMTRHAPYLRSARGKMPDRVDVACESLDAKGGMAQVRSFPRDLRAAHGYDNQANQLTLSPLLMDSFLRLSISIFESPDFHEGTVGIWKDFFQEPADSADQQAEVVQRIGPFLLQAFRGPVDEEIIHRYTAYATAKLQGGLPFTETMKKVASAALSSPLFLYRHTALEDERGLFDLASKLSFFLWGTSPDMELLRLAESGELGQPEVLNKTVDRMLAAPEIERFLDSFAPQWMQLENVLAATPDPGKQRYFRLDGSNPASVQMVLEPLLLFDAIFIEDRPIMELIAPSFSYRSDFLRTWYESDLQVPAVDRVKVDADNKKREEVRSAIEARLGDIRAELGELDKGLPALIATQLETFDVAVGQALWEATQEDVLAQSVAYSHWSRIGPFKAGNFDEAHTKSFFDEAAVDLTAAHGDLRWAEMPNFVDGKTHSLTGSNCATYLYRKIQAGAARQLKVSLGTDDSFKMWLNGKLVAENKITRGLAPDQERLTLELNKGANTLLMKVVNGGGGYGFYFKGLPTTLSEPVLAAFQVESADRSPQQLMTITDFYLTVAPELAPLRASQAEQKATLQSTLKDIEVELQRAPKPQPVSFHQQEAQKNFDNRIRGQMRARTFQRVPASDPRYGGVITNAAMLSMTSGPNRSHPIARGAWILEVIFNDPPDPPPNDVPPLEEADHTDNMTIRERFAQHRADPTCASCHSRLDPLGFALENFDLTGRWRDGYDNGRDVEPGGTLLKKYDFADIVEFKAALVQEERRFAKAFAGHLLRFALARELSPGDSLIVDDIVNKTEKDGFKLRSIIREVVMSEGFRPTN